MTMIIREIITIQAPLETVWDVFATVENWSDWNPVCQECRFESGDCLAAGASLSFELSPLIFPIRIAPTVTEYEKGRSVTWAGSKWGIHAEHTFNFEPGPQGVSLESMERFSGPMLLPARLIGIPKRLHKLTRHLIAAIKTAAESRFNAGTI